MSMAMIPLNQGGLATVRAIEGHDFNELIAKQFYMMSPDGNIFIKKAGLQKKMEQKFGNDWRDKAEPVMGEEYQHFRMAEGIAEGKPFQVFKAYIYAKGNEQPFTAYGMASEKDCKNGQYLIMAETRAKNRAMRTATNCGFTSVEEMIEKETLQEVKERIALTSPPKNDDIQEIKKVFSERTKRNDIFFVEGKYKMDNLKNFFLQNIAKIPGDPSITFKEWSILIQALDNLENPPVTDDFNEEDLEIVEAEFTIPDEI